MFVYNWLISNGRGERPKLKIFLIHFSCSCCDPLPLCVTPRHKQILLMRAFKSIACLYSRYVLFSSLSFFRKNEKHFYNVRSNFFSCTKVLLKSLMAQYSFWLDTDIVVWNVMLDRCIDQDLAYGCTQTLVAVVPFTTTVTYPCHHYWTTCFRYVIALLITAVSFFRGYFSNLHLMVILPHYWVIVPRQANQNFVFV